MLAVERCSGSKGCDTSANSTERTWIGRKQYKARLAAHYGVVQPQCVVAPGALLAKTAHLRPWFAASYAYVSSLKPKPTTKEKTAKPKRIRK
jgi:hypothetical protein